MRILEKGRKKTNFGISIIICKLLVNDFSSKYNKENNKNSLFKIKY